VVNMASNTLGVKRKLDDQAPECRSCEATEAVDLWIYVDLSRLWDKRSIGRLLAEVHASELQVIS
jgi:hypothetical protein